MVLERLEVRQNARVVPAGIARIGPAVEIASMTAGEDHGVEAARAAQDVAAGPVVDPVGRVRLRRGRKPLGRGRAERGAPLPRVVDLGQVVGTARLEHQHPGVARGGEPVRERGAGRARTDDDDVVGAVDGVDLPARGGEGARCMERGEARCRAHGEARGQHRVHEAAPVEPAQAIGVNQSIERALGHRPSSLSTPLQRRSVLAIGVAVAFSAGNVRLPEATAARCARRGTEESRSTDGSPSRARSIHGSVPSEGSCAPPNRSTNRTPKAW